MNTLFWFVSVLLRDLPGGNVRDYANRSVQVQRRDWCTAPQAAADWLPDDEVGLKSQNGRSRLCLFPVVAVGGKSFSAFVLSLFGW